MFTAKKKESKIKKKRRKKEFYIKREGIRMESKFYGISCI